MNQMTLFATAAVRWIVFVPVSIIGVSILQVIPLLIYKWTRGQVVEMDFGTIVLAVMAALTLLSFAWPWVVAVISFPSFVAVLAPNKKFGVFVFSIVFVLLEYMTVFSFVADSAPSGIIIYHVVFSLVVLCGCFFQLSQAEQSRL